MPAPPLATRFLQLLLERVWASLVSAQASRGFAEPDQFVVSHLAQSRTQLLRNRREVLPGFFAFDLVARCYWIVIKTHILVAGTHMSLVNFVGVEVGTERVFASQNIACFVRVSLD
jgi:hypothetical protein